MPFTVAVIGALRVNVHANSKGSDLPGMQSNLHIESSNIVESISKMVIRASDV